jgi:GntR family transcriptional repressor for pyruvate dehydrogenase complex
MSAQRDEQVKQLGDARDARSWLQSPRSARVPDLIARTLMREIVSRNLQPGDMMPSEAALLKRFRVGRASLREALRILENHGVVRIKPGPGGGPMVDEVTSEDFGRSTSIYLSATRATQRELLEARMLVEPMMARLAAERLTPEIAERINEITKQGWEAIDEPATMWSEQSQRFHQILAGASGNRVLDVFGSALICIHRDQVGAVFPSSSRKTTLKVHDRIAAAVLAKDGATAERLTLRHIEELIAFFNERRDSDLDELIEWR